MIFSVIIPTCDRNELLAKCLDLLSPSIQNISPSIYEVIVTDDSKNIGAKKLIDNRYKWVKWIKGPAKGPAANRNNGAKYAKGGWLIFIDDDCLPDCALLISYFQEVKNEFRALEGAITVERPQQRFDEEAPINLGGGLFWSCNIAVEKKLFEQVKGFDEGFPYAVMEDVDLHIRIKAITKIKFVPFAKVVHPWRKMKPFTSYKRHLASHKYINNKYGHKFKMIARLKRAKIFVVSAFVDLISLSKFSFKGVGFYFEKLYLNFRLIFS